RDDPEGEVDRRRDLAVGDREEGRRIEDALKSWQLSGHDRSLCPLAAREQDPEAARAGAHEQQAEQIAEPAADDASLDHQRDPDPDEDDRERKRRCPVRLHAAWRPAATTMTRQGAFFRTKSTVSLKIVLRGRPRRGAPMTMISVSRRFASMTIARPAL